MHYRAYYIKIDGFSNFATILLLAPDYFIAEDIEMMDTIYKTVLMTEKNREQRKARVRKYLGWVSQETKLLTCQ